MTPCTPGGAWGGPGCSARACPQLATFLGALSSPGWSVASEMKNSRKAALSGWAHGPHDKTNVLIPLFTVKKCEGVRRMTLWTEDTLCGCWECLSNIMC